MPKGHRTTQKSSQSQGSETLMWEASLVGSTCMLHECSSQRGQSVASLSLVGELPGMVGNI